MRVRHHATHLMGEAVKLNSSRPDEVLIVFDDGDPSSESVKDYEVKLPGGWWSLEDAIKMDYVMVNEATDRLYVVDDGLYDKYTITKTDGTPVDPEAKYLVLRLDTDPAAKLAAREYAQAVAYTMPQLAKDIELYLRGEHYSLASCFDCRFNAICATFHDVAAALRDANTRQQLDFAPRKQIASALAWHCRWYEETDDAKDSYGA